MAIRPTDIPSLKDRDALDRAEKELDQKLLDGYRGVDLFLCLPDCTPYRHRNTLVDRYRAAGWRVYRESSPEDGPGCNGAWYFGAPTDTKPPAEAQ